MVQGTRPRRGADPADRATQADEPAAPPPGPGCVLDHGAGTVPVGRVETGLLKVGMKIHFNPSDKVGEVKSIEMHHEQIPQAEPGDNVGFNVRGIDKKDLRRGDVAGPTDNPPTIAKSFTAQIVVLNHPSVITAGYTPAFHAPTPQD